MLSGKTFQLISVFLGRSGAEHGHAKLSQEQAWIFTLNELVRLTTLLKFRK